MPIIPFTDRDKVNLGVSYYAPINIATGSLASGDIDRFRQGVSVRTTADALKKITPLISSTGLPYNTRALISHEIDRTTYGNVQFFTDTDNDISISPYDDISSLRDPVKYLQDSGITSYPQVMMSPNWLDPGQKNGIIEPLSVRGTLADATIDSPFVAHTIRASFTPAPVEYAPYGKFEKDDAGVPTPFIDSQDVSIRGKNFKLASDGISDFGTMPALPFDEYATTVNNSLKSQDESIFNDYVGVGIISKKISSTFNFKSEKVVQRGKSGIRTRIGIESLAFGGLLK